jgi:hypothetical protein
MLFGDRGLANYRAALALEGASSCLRGPVTIFVDRK